MLLFVLLFFEVAGRVGLGPRLLLDRLFTLGSLAFGLERASSLAVGGWVCVCVEGGECDTCCISFSCCLSISELQDEELIWRHSVYCMPVQSACTFLIL